MRESLFSVDGWGGNFVNQSTVWDLPKSPQFNKRTNSSNNDSEDNLHGNDNQLASQNSGSNSSKFNNFCWNKINNGTELWEANLRSGGQLAAASGNSASSGINNASQEKQKRRVPYHPLTNLGGIWGENEFEHEIDMEFNNMEGNQHQNVMNFGNENNGDDDENVFIRKKHQDAFENYHHEFLGGNNANAVSGISNVGGNTNATGTVGGNATVGINSPAVNANANDSVIRGDPRGISGRLNGNPEIWNQNQQSFSSQSNFFNSQNNFPNKSQIFPNQPNFMNFSQMDKNPGIDFNTPINQANSQFNQATNVAQKRNSSIAGGNSNAANSAGGAGFNNFVDELGTSIWGNFNAQNTPNINQNTANVINQNFTSLRNPNQMNIKRGGGNAVVGNGVSGATGMVSNPGSANWGDIDKVSASISGASGWTKFNNNDKPSGNAWPSATPPIQSSTGSSNPNGNNVTQLNPQNTNLQISQAQNLMNTPKFDNSAELDWKNSQKNFNLPNQELFHPNQITQNAQKPFLPFPYPMKNNQNQRYLNSSNANELLFSAPGSTSNSSVAGTANSKVGKIDDFGAPCDTFGAAIPDDFMMYNKNQNTFTQPNTPGSGFNFNNQKQNLSSIHFNQLNEYNASAGMNPSVNNISNVGNESVDRLNRANNGASGFHPQNPNNQMPQSPPISMDNPNRMLLERGMSNPGMQSVGAQPPPNHPLQQPNQRGNFGSFQPNQVR